MQTIEHSEAQGQLTRRRLLELEIAVGIDGRAAAAWHIAQARRSGASAAEVMRAIRAGIENGGGSFATMREPAPAAGTFSP